MSRFLDAMRAAGFGSDPGGDARRRADLPGEVRRLDADTARYLAERGIGFRNPEVQAAIRADLSRRAARIAEEANRMTPGQRRREHPVTDTRGAPMDDAWVDEPYSPPVVPGHHLSQEAKPQLHGVVATCECGRWDGFYTGARSRRRVLDDWAAHCAAELRAAGPIKVKAERAVKCAVCPFATGCRDGAGPCRAEETGWTPPPRELEP